MIKVIKKTNIHKLTIATEKDTWKGNLNGEKPLKLQYNFQSL